MSDGSIRINPELAIPLAEISYRASRSGGPGGQHVNTSSTRVELVWNVDESAAITPEQRELIRARLGTRISGEGILSLASATTRSQHRNREDVTDRFADLLRDALHVATPRRKTRPSRAAREKRLKAKRQRAELKKTRGPISPE